MILWIQDDRHWAQNNEITNSTNADKLPGISEYKGIRKYVPESRTPPNLMSCLRGQERIPKAEYKNNANISEYSLYLQGPITQTTQGDFYI